MPSVLIEFELIDMGQRGKLNVENMPFDIYNGLTVLVLTSVHQTVGLLHIHPARLVTKMIIARLACNRRKLVPLFRILTKYFQSADPSSHFPFPLG